MTPTKMHTWEFAHLTWEKLLLARSYHYMINEGKGNKKDLHSKIDSCKQIFQDTIERLIKYEIIIDGKGYLDKPEDRVLALEKSDCDWKYEPCLKKFGDWYLKMA